MDTPRPTRYAGRVFKREMWAQLAMVLGPLVLGLLAALVVPTWIRHFGP